MKPTRIAGRSLPATLLWMVLFARSAAGTFPGDYPTETRPWMREGNEEALKDYQAAISEMMALPAGQVTAHPAAADFPGAVPTNAPHLRQTVVVDSAVPRWHSTGLYAPPGEPITVRVPEIVVSQNLAVRIGCHQDKLWAGHIRSWKRVPEITRTFRLTNTLTEAANAFGGLIYLVVPENCGAGEFEAEISGAVAAPLFELGKTSAAEWRERLRKAPAPWAELAGRQLILSLPSENIRTLDDPQEVMRFWDAVVQAQDELAAVTDRSTPERIVLDRQISAGYMHSGYPIMAHLDQAGGVAIPGSLRKGNWGLFHELGHNHQSPDWTFNGTGEVTCNLFSMYCFERVCGLPMEGHEAMQPDKRAERLRNYFSNGSKFEKWKSDPFLGLLTYHQLIKAFGWDAFRSVFAEYRALPREERPANDEERRDQFMVRFSREAGHNLGPFFETWRIPTSAEARQSIAELPAWLPEDFPPGMSALRTPKP